MNVALRRPMTVAAFLEWEARQETKWEFDGLRPVAMAGGTQAHDMIQGNVKAVLWTHLRGHRCRVCGPDLKVLVDGRIRYPDAFVACTPMQPNATVQPDPVIVFEVLSPSTQEIDRIDKNAEYEATPSVQRYVMLEPARMAATVFHRAGGEWIGRLLVEGATLDLPEIGLSVPLAELYAGVEPSAPEPLDAS
jgi:Uma2 family endonuclease